MVSISKSSIVQDIWKIFYDRVKDQVTTVNITGVGDVTVQNYVSSYSDKILSSKSNYPILVVESPSLNTEYFTASKDKFLGTIDIEILTNQAESADKFISAIIESIETYRQTMRDAGISMVDLKGTDTDMVERGAIKIHLRRVTYSFEYHYTKT